MKIIQPVLLATMISSAVFLLIGSAGTGRPDGDPGDMNRTYTYEGSAGTALAHAGQSALYQKVTDHSAKNIAGSGTVETKSAGTRTAVTGTPENGTVETKSAGTRTIGTANLGNRTPGNGTAGTETPRAETTGNGAAGSTTLVTGIVGTRALGKGTVGTGTHEKGTVGTETALNRAAGTGAPGTRSVGTGETTADPSASPGRHTTRSSSALISYNAGTGYRGRPQNPLKYDKTMQNNSHQSRIVQFPMQPIDLTINPSVTPVHAFE